jgi:hypothetical protein
MLPARLIEFFCACVGGCRMALGRIAESREKPLGATYLKLEDDRNL